jgi:exodeoxyribonuclease V beta subunit
MNFTKGSFNMPAPFNVLDRQVNVHRSLFLEASAGTGKTFSIENIVVRLLLESDQCSIENILVVTFTRAAARELKTRIRSHIQKGIQYLNALLAQERPEPIADYLLAYAEKGEETIHLAKNRLEQALFCYDEAPITTIHSFCMRALRRNPFEVGMGLHATLVDEQLTPEDVLQVIRDFFRTGTHSDRYSPSQLAILFKDYQQDIKKVEKAIYRLLTKGFPISPTQHFSDYFDSFNRVMTQLKTECRLKADNIIADFHAQLPFYKKPKQTHLLKQTDEKIKRFATLFEKEQWTLADLNQLIDDQLVFAEMLDPSLLKVRSKGIQDMKLHYPDLQKLLHNHLLPLIRDASHPNLILCRMACDCQQLLNRVLAEEEKLGADDLLHTMHRALENPLFVGRLRKNYCAVVIDEFQDTDPIQWSIFSKLFDPKEWTGNLYLVGDPKQSIYSFRQADIYTYLKAAETIGESGKAFLNVNYRSQPTLIKAFNLLFSSTHSPGIIALPTLASSIPYIAVECPSTATVREFSDQRGAIHFAFVEEKQGRASSWPSHPIEEAYLFPFIAQEILNLHKNTNVAFKENAILVRDRFQAERIAAFLKQYGIPTLSQRQTTVAESPALQAWIDLLQAALNPMDGKAIRKALAGKIVGWTDPQLQALKEQEQLQQQIFNQWQRLHQILLQDGIIPFYDTLLHSKWHNESVLESLLAKPEGADLYQDMQQLAEILIERQHETQEHPEQLLRFLKEIDQLEEQNDPKLNRKIDLTQDAVRIMTLHASKGLEFNIVFALGLASRTPTRETTIPLKKEEKTLLFPSEKASEKENLQFQHELDAEKMRLLYVGMTRAKHRLYLPLALANEGSSIEYGEASPIELFLSTLGQSHGDNPYQRLQNYSSAELVRFIDTHVTERCITYENLKESAFELTQMAPQRDPELTPPASVAIPGKHQFVYSFTSLTKTKQQRDGWGEASPQDYGAVDKSAYTLPAGVETGLLLHLLFEKLPFDAVRAMHDPKQLIPLITPYMKDHPLEQWVPTIAEIVFHTLRAPINGWRLCDIDMAQSYRELEFLYPWDSQEPTVAEMRYEEGYLKGVIDLVFQHQGQYYIVDWKSNWLGSNEQDYQQEKLFSAMQDHHYILQAEIYTAALKRYLALVEPRPFQECFGGIYYLFVRGMHEHHQTGIFHQ